MIRRILFQVASLASTALGVADPAAATGSEPVQLTISVHVEGWRGEATNATTWQNHADQVEAIAEIAADHGAILSLELSADFVTGMASFDPSWGDQMEALGHTLGIHADLGGTPLPTSRFASRLTQMRSALSRLGHDAVTVSGICSESEWVEAADRAGFEVVTSITEFCLKSLDPMPAEFAAIESCTNPAVCHGAAFDDERRMTIWHTSGSEDWITDDPAGSMTMVVGEGGHSLPCLDEAAAGGCTLGAGDLTALDAALAGYVAANDGSGTYVASYGWSIGSRQTPEIVEAMFEVYDTYVDAGQAVWVSPDTLA